MSIKINEDKYPYKDNKKPLPQSLKKWFLVLILVSIVHLIGLFAIDSGLWSTDLMPSTQSNFKKNISVQLNYIQDVKSKTPRLSNSDQTVIETNKSQKNPEQQKLSHDRQSTSEKNSTKSLVAETQTINAIQQPTKETTTTPKVIEKQKTVSTEITRKQQSASPPTTKKSNPISPPDDFKDFTEIKKPISLADSFEIVQESLPTLQQKKDDTFKNVFSQEYKTALQDAIQEQKQYLKGFIKNKGYQITKDSDGTRYVNIKGICWKMPPEGESGEWFIVPAGCNNQKESFHFEFGITPEMLSPNSPFSRLLGLEFDPKQ